MILILGGTTEGRMAASVCDEASKTYYYSTKGESQEIKCAHGTRLTGAMNTDRMIEFCKTQNIKLIVDAAHPFAEVLHQTVAKTAEHLNIPVARYERNYPDHEEDLIWCDNYLDAIKYLSNHNINNLLALTGVNTIEKLKPYWEQHSCWFRILDRNESREIVQRSGFPFDHILYYTQGEDESLLFDQLNPEAIITKESGDSGGFNDKVEAARKLNIPIIVVKRPKLSDTFHSVYGQNGLRKFIEKTVPDFFELRTGYTTGTCATAATKAALTALLTKNVWDKISVTLPSGEWIYLPISKTEWHDDAVSCTVIKDAGDDPDATNKQEIVSTVRLDTSYRGVRFLQGKGVGVVTLPGLGIDIGDPAINATPRKMIKREVFKVLRHNQYLLPNQHIRIGVDVTLSVPNGEEIAKRTFNPKLGIIGGISIIGTSGIVKPFSSDAFLRSIRREMDVAQALGCKQIVLNSGAKSEKFVKNIYPALPSQAFIQYGNFIGETIKIANDLAFEKVSIGIMLGKAVKLAEGSLDTHSKKVVMNKIFLQEIATSKGCSRETIEAIDNITLARELWGLIKEDESNFFSEIINRCYQTCKCLIPNGELSVLLIDEDGNIYK